MQFVEEVRKGTKQRNGLMQFENKCVNGDCKRGV
jgi:hypothetical protein